MIIDARALSGDHFGQGNGSVLLSNVRCEPERDMTILECCKRDPEKESNSRYCDHGSAGVRCQDGQLVNNVSVSLFEATSIPTIKYHDVTVLITWQLWQNITRAIATPHSFEVTCFNAQHIIKIISLSNTTITTQVGGLLHGSYYTCCVSAIYEMYTAKGVCTQTETQVVLTTETISSNIGASNLNSMNIVLFIVFGTIVASLLVLSTLLCMVLIYQTRKRMGKRVPTIHTHTR